MTLKNERNAMVNQTNPLHVFISFATEDISQARQLQHTLSQLGYSVWWQEKLQCGREWHSDIDAALQHAGCVIVLWSHASQASPWVKHEASQAIAKRVYAPARVEVLKIDTPFDRIQAIDLIDWTGNVDHPGFQGLLQRVRELLPPPVRIATRVTRFFRRNLAAIAIGAFAAVAVSLLLWLARSVDSQIVQLQRIGKDQTRTVTAIGQSQQQLALLVGRLDKALEPELTPIYKFSIGDNSPGYLRIENTGGGLARITSIRASLDGSPIETDAGTLSEIGRRFGLVGYTLKVGQTIAPGGSVRIFEIPYSSEAATCIRDKARKDFFERLRLEADYTSLNGVTKTLPFEYKNPNTRNC